MRLMRRISAEPATCSRRAFTAPLVLNSPGGAQSGPATPQCQAADEAAGEARESGEPQTFPSGRRWGSRAARLVSAWARSGATPSAGAGEREDEAASAAGEAGTGTSSALGASFNILCIVVGTGLLNLPYAVSRSGWVGVPLLVLMAAMATYTAALLGRCIVLVEEEERRAGGMRASLASRATPPPRGASSVSYGDLGEAAYGRPGRWFVNSQVHITLVGVAIVYHLLAALNIHSLAADSLSMAASVALVAALVWLHVFLKTLGEVALLSYFNIAVNVALLCTVVAASLERPPASPPRTALVASDAFAFGSAFASFGFAYGVHPVLPSVRASMRSPRLYPRTVVASMAGTLLFYLPISAVCYARYGDAVRSPVMDTPPLAGSPAVRIVTAAITAHLVLSYPLLAITPEAALEGLLRVESRAAPLLWRIGVRSAFVAFTAAVALLVRTPERFGPLLDLVSSCTSTFTVFLLPSAFYLKLRGVRGMHPLEVAWNGLIVAFASVGAVFGTLDAIDALAKSV